MLIELHVVQNHAPSNLNRDDTGSPKTAYFGGWPRARISSQCIKRSIRRSRVFHDLLGSRLGFRTRSLPERVREMLRNRGYPDTVAELAARKATGFGTKDGREREADENDGSYATAQTMLLSQGDVDAVVDVLVEKIDETKRDPKKIAAIDVKSLQKHPRLKGYRPLTVDAALFGRMITSDAFRDAEAAMQVAHAISTHRVEQESDYFTAVDDLKHLAASDDAGADMIGDIEFNSACYYKYFSLDVDGLVENLTGERPFGRTASEQDRKDARALAGNAVEATVRATALVTPTGKQNTFAAHQLPSLMLIEVRERKTPISYANAFVKPVVSSPERSLIDASVDAMSSHVDRLTRAFNLEASARLVLEPEAEWFRASGVSRVKDLDTLARQTREAIGA